MATQLFLHGDFSGDPEPDTHRGTNTAKRDGVASGWECLALTASRGSAARSSDSTPTVTGATNGVEVRWNGFPAEWISPPVSADVTISGTITANIWSSESNMSANVAINVIIDILRANSFGGDGSNTIQNIVQSTRVTELAVTTRAVNNFTTGMTSGAYTGQTVNRGDRIRVRIVGDDVGTMATGFTFDIAVGAASGAVDGDTYVTFTENFSFESAPAGSILYLTDTPVTWGTPVAPALVSAFTGADESPLSEGGNWANLDTAQLPLQRISNQAASSAAGTSHSYWTPANFGPDLEAYVTLATQATAQAIAVRVQGEGGSGTWDGYLVEQGGGGITIRRVTNATFTTLLSTALTWASGDKLGVRVGGSTIQCWRQASGSGTWNLVATAVDATYTSAGKIALYSTGTLGRLDDFYCATNSNLFTQEAWTSRGAGVVSYRADTDAGWV